MIFFDDTDLNLKCKFPIYLSLITLNFFVKPSSPFKFVIFVFFILNIFVANNLKIADSENYFLRKKEIYSTVFSFSFCFLINNLHAI